MDGDLGEHLAFVGKKYAVEDIITPTQIQRLAVTLNRDDPTPKPGDALPPGWQTIFFPRLTRNADLQPDGMAPEVPGQPDPPLPRRMYAGNKMIFHTPIRVGDTVTKEFEISDFVPKEGRSGKLIFSGFHVRYTTASGTLAMEEQTSIVYREAEKPGAKPPPGQPGPESAAWEDSVTPDEVMLARFSACTFNPHRIHYDHPYVTQKEGYPALIVHGPLTAILLLELLRTQAPDRVVAEFDMQARGALYCGKPIRLLGQPEADGGSATLWAVDPNGMVGMQAKAVFA